MTPFFTTFLLTILITRIFLYLHPTPSPTIGRFRLHHYMYGIIGIGIGAVIANETLFAIGLGLFIDELTFIIIGGKTHADNYSRISLLGTLFFIIIIFFAQEHLIK